ncbi:MAG: galactose mutarotase [Bacteroidales bacterium]|nr:galactose mutarotase [Bacteroidales bacterium]
MEIKKSVFGKFPCGKEIFAFEITTDSGLYAKAINYGATVTELKVPDKEGKIDDIVLGFDKLKKYMGNHPFFGAAIGRYGNRIGGAKFTINGQEYKLTPNEKNNTLHGGKGFHRAVWDAEEVKNDSGAGIKFSYLSKHLEDGFPGNLKVEVTYLFTNQNEFKINYQAETDQPTHVNLTQHSYFNLNACKDYIFDHEIMIDADQVTELNNEQIPTGKMLDIKGTPFDLTELKPLGTQIKKLSDKGFDHNYVLNKKDVEMALVAKVIERKTGRMIEVFTNEPGIQLYTGNYIGKIKGKNRIKYKDFYGLCLETQHFPDSPNKPEFPSTLLKPGEKYESQTIYKFSIIN